eukprot:scaffold672626_cov90-Attheya_sp.AAC.3
MSSNTDEFIWADDLIKKIIKKDGRKVDFFNGLNFGNQEKLKDHHVMDVLRYHVNADQLEELWVCGCNITDDGIIAIAKKYGQHSVLLQTKNKIIFKLVHRLVVDMRKACIIDSSWLEKVGCSHSIDYKISFWVVDGITVTTAAILITNKVTRLLDTNVHLKKIGYQGSKRIESQ